MARAAGLQGAPPTSIVWMWLELGYCRMHWGAFGASSWVRADFRFTVPLRSSFNSLPDDLSRGGNEL